MRKITRTTLAATAVAGLLALPVSSAGADTATQIITATVGDTVTIDSEPADTDLGTLPATAASIGSITVNANGPYLLTAVSDKDRMTSWDGSTYDDSTTLASPLTIISTPSVGTGTGLPGGGAVNSSTSITVGANLLSGILTTTDTYALTATQPATALDAAGDYRLIVTYTAALDLP